MKSGLKSFQTVGVIEAGVDEAGRGPALGRVYAAAVIWPPGLSSPLVKDSKKIKESHMREAYDFVTENVIDYAVAYATEEEIDRCNILQADMMAMHRALDKLRIIPQQILVDGDYFNIYNNRRDDPVNYSTVVGGDDVYYAIAAASILAKYSRDQYIRDLCRNYPELDQRYDICHNKGYLSKKHMDGLREYGVTQFHRRSFKCCRGPEAPVTKS